MKNRRVKKVCLVLTMLLLLLSMFIFKISNSNKVSKIDKVLKSSEYSYLPKEAKNYIREVYEESGKIILTEKNKKKNEPYLNPSYVTYLGYSEEEKKELGEIPVSLIVDYIPTDIEEANLPSSYDLRNVNGKNYVTPVRDQGNLGICWTFASAGSAESYLLKKSNTSYNSSSRLISERQIDYATALNGIKDYQSEYSDFIARLLGDGGNFFISTIAMAGGVSLFDYNNFKEYYDFDLDRMELADVLSYDKSLYELNSTINMPNMELRASTSQLTSSEQETRNNYLNTIKQNIIDNGVAYVGTYMDSTCQYKDTNLNNTVIDVYNCNYSGGHAMGIIGWNDNLQYTYCNDNNNHTSNTTNCSNIVTGKGVWILKNSWGSIQQYPYLTYDSLGSSIHFITNLTENNGSAWKNNYLLGEGSMAYQSKSYTLTDTKIRNDETSKKVKFISYTEDTTFTVKVKKKDGTYETVSKSVTLPGLVTVDIPNNVVVTSSTQINITASGGFFIDKLMVFTDNIDTTPYIDLGSYNNISINESGKRFYSDTKAIPSGSVITYKFYNANNVEVSNRFTVTNNIVAENNVNTLIYFGDSVEHGLYRVDVLYNNSVIGTFNINVIKMSGQGTEDQPFIVTTPEQLSQIRNNPSAYYELGNDIDLTRATRAGGDLSQPSDVCQDVFGWEAINDFSGSLDGKGHTIKGLYQNNYIYCVEDDGNQWWNLNDEGNGLFGRVKGNATIKNIILDSFDITCQNGYCGALISNYTANMDGNGYTNSSDHTVYTANIKNIAIKNSRVNGLGDEGLYGGGLLGHMESTYGTINIDGIYLDIDRELDEFESDGYLINTIEANVTSISNIHANGDFVGKDSNSSVLIGEVDASKTVSIKNVLSTMTVSNTSSNLLGEVYGNNLTISNINILKNENKPLCLNGKCSGATNVKVFDKDTELGELTKSSNYSTWDNFGDNWEFKTINGVARIPVLKFMNFDYSEVANITLNQQLNNNHLIFNYLTPEIKAARRISYTSNDDSILTITDEGDLIPHKSGQTTIHVENLYDGYIKNVPITVNYVPHYVIHFEANGGTGKMDDIEVAAGTNYRIPSNEFTRDDYDFKEWSTAADGTGSAYANLAQVPGKNDKETLTLYAQWIGEEKVVTFDPNGGTVDPSTKTVRYQEKYGELPIPTRAGYGFSGWFCGATSIDSESLVDCTSLMAGWTNNAFTLIYDANGGTKKENLGNEYYRFASDTTFISLGFLDNDTYINKSPFERNGYEFKGWNTAADGTGTSYSANSNASFSDIDSTELRLYAMWQSDETNYIVHFNANGGTGTMNDYIYSTDETGTLPKNTFTKPNYTFSKWCTNADGTGTCFNDQDTINNLFGNNEFEKTLYAIWESNVITVTFNANYGSNATSTQTMTKNQSTALNANAFLRTNYKFVKWNTKADGTGTSYNDKQTVSFSSDVTLYAIWEINIITVTFNANYGSNATSTQTMTKNQSTALNANTFTRTNYKFIKWNTKANGTGTSYNDKQTVSFSSNITLYAIWEEIIPYVISTYTVDENNRYIDKIVVGTDINTFKAKITLGSGYSIVVDTKTVNNKQVLYTGGKTKIMNGSTVYREFTNIVRGDINGDGKMSSLDYVKVKNHIMGTNVLTDIIYKTAADANDDNKISALDYVKIKNYIMNGG